MSHNKKIGDGLREAHADWARADGRERRSIRLPADTQIQFFKSGPDAHIHMSGVAASSNMQTNAAGFEGWALALRLWLGFREITLHWTPPNRTEDQPLNRHYARFLYRVQRFAELFPDWFRIGTTEHLAECVVRAGDDLFLNVAGASSRDPSEPKRETKIERSLVSDHAALLKKALRLHTVDRQFPVGLYRTTNLKEPVFTGGTSAIDIVGVSDGGSGEFTIVELKAGDNIMVGALSELLFYASVVRDAACSRFRFGGKLAGASRSHIGPEQVTSAKRVRAILMAEQFHPLLDHPNLIPTLNEATRQQQGSIPLSFEQWLLSDFDAATGPRLQCVAA